ncbi:MAG: hypothetical protein KDD35_04420 [Bdellovibrionales bacterium]|nr:hypothetical protein [Bdellovibrionales bacterium]
MKKIVLLTTENLKGHVRDNDLLARELSQRGYSVKEKAWEGLDDEGEDLFLIRTTWNYTERCDEFLRCLEKIEGRLWNPFSLVEWNCNKKYLIELLQKGLRVLPLRVIDDSEALEEAMDDLGGNEFIVKPLVGAGAKGLKYFDRSSLPRFDEEVIVQRFYSSISQGEVSLIYYAHQFAYAVRKTPRLGEIRVQTEYGGNITPYIPSPEEICWAEEILKCLPTDWLYARVDILPGQGLIELECIEPDLYFSSNARGVNFMVDAVSKLFGQH